MCLPRTEQHIALITASPISGLPGLPVIPEEQRSAVSKETMQTAHVECWNTTLRQRLARFVRKTLSFSSFFTATTVTILSFSCEPLPRREP